jgi:hypothetical protein
MQRVNLFGPFISCEENEVFRPNEEILNLQHRQNQFLSEVGLARSVSRLEVHLGLKTSCHRHLSGRQQSALWCSAQRRSVLMTLSITTLCIMTFSTATLSITIKNTTLSIMAHDTAKLRVIYPECHYAECRLFRGSFMVSVANKLSMLHSTATATRSRERERANIHWHFVAHTISFDMGLTSAEG